jgi:regulator of protease activity HflC (stomatin/prohibitin superfamily)
VNAGERGIMLEFGKPVAILNEGWNWKIPIADSSAIMNVRTVKFESKASSASKNLQTVETDIALNYHIDYEKVVDIYRSIGTNDMIEQTVIAPQIQESVKAATAAYNVEELIQERQAVKQKIEETLKARLENRGIYVETLSIVNFDFSPEYNKAIEQKQVAQQNALTAANVLEQKKIEADQMRATAQGDADAKLMVAKAEAESIKIQALKSSPDVVSLRMIEKWDGKLPVISGAQSSLINLPADLIK